MFAVSNGVSQSVESSAGQEDVCDAYAHTLEVLHQWQELQGAVNGLAALETAQGSDE